jgi:transcriptional regulator NrdR family protein
MKRTKKDLIQALESMTDHRDILVDKLEGVNYTIKDLEEEVSELEGKAETLDILTDLINCYYIAYIRYHMGVMSELETIEKLTEKLLDMRSIN